MTPKRVGLALLLVALAGSLPAQSSLFGRRASALDTEPPGAAMPEPEPPEKGKAEPEDPFAAPAKPAEPEDPFAKPSGGGDKENPRRKDRDKDKEGQGDRHKGDRDAEPDTGVRVRPVDVASASLDAGVAERADFRLANLGKPYAKVETAASFARVWHAFRHQHRLVDGKFEPLPGRPRFLKGKLLQDLGQGRWLMGEVQLDSQFPPSEGFLKGGAGRQQPSQAVVVLADGRGAAGETLILPVLPVGTVDVRFDCLVPPAEGRRVTLRRPAHVEAPVLPDDEATREAFRAAVAAQGLVAVLPESRDCRTCNGLGFVRRPVPGKIQDARDACGACASTGKVTADVAYRFRP